MNDINNHENKKYILFTLDAYIVGGVTTHIQQYCSAIDSTYHIIILGRRGDIDTHRYLFPNATCVVIPETIKPGMLARFTDIYSYIKYVHKIFSQYRIYGIHFSTEWSTFYSLLYPKTWSCKRIITYHGAGDLEAISQRLTHATVINRLGDILRYHLQRIGLMSAHKIIVLSQYAKRQLISHFHLTRVSQKITVIPGTIKPTYLPMAKTLSKHFTIINIGRAEPNKGISMLLTALAILRKKGVLFTAYIAGPVWYYKWTDVLDIYEKLDLFTNVHMLHAIDEKEKDYLFKVADVAVVPSVDLETFGYSIIESLSHGVPVIGTPTGSIPEILSGVNKRLIAKFAKADDLANTILWFYSLSSMEKRLLRKRSVRCVKEKYNQQAWTSTMISVYS